MENFGRYSEDSLSNISIGTVAVDPLTIIYLTFGSLRLGLIRVFDVSQIKSGIKRVILTKGPRQF
jgi:hypothetical protein